MDTGKTAAHTLTRSDKSMSDNNDQQEPELQQLINENQARLQKRLLNELVAVQNRLYSQLESLSWLQKALDRKSVV